MHEHALIHNIVDAILKDKKLTPGSRVREVRLSLGALEFHSEEAFRQGFAVEARGTSLDGAALTLSVNPPSLECKACGHKTVCKEGSVDPHEQMPVRECPKCQELASISGGRDVGPIELVLED